MATAAATGSRPCSKLRHRAGEITVTRRLFRSGESEYLINGQVCRLRDIQDLFMGTGLGPESYAIIEQGRIGQILSSRPSDRRLILEEAAGISKFKTRKRLAEAKLESSRQNLSRIADILEEVTKQVNSLKRQASKARRYKELHEELRGRLKVVLTSRLGSPGSGMRPAGRRSDPGAGSVPAQRRRGWKRWSRSRRPPHSGMRSGSTSSRNCASRLSQGGLERERLLSRCEQVRQQAASLEARAAEAARERAGFEAQLSFTGTADDREKPSSSSRSSRIGLRRKERWPNWSCARNPELPGGGSGGGGGIMPPGLDGCREPCGGAAQPACAGRGGGPGALAPSGAHRIGEAARGGGTPALAAELEASIAAQRQGTTSLADLAQTLGETAAALEQARSEEVSLRSGA